ncbi:hypothetical protein M8J75_013182 [Diaphorina citri]|nr:hypothetical protein M8J75_013182 [Diaphorina citri]
MGTPRRGLGYNPLGKERENSDIKKGDLEPPDLMATGPLSVSVRKGITTIIQEVFTLKESLIPNTRAEIKLGIERLYEVIAKMVPEVNKVHFTDESIWKKIKQEHKEGNQNSVREPQRKEDTIRNGLKKISEGDFGLICNLLDTEWPESVFERTKINYQFPLAGGKRGNLALLFSQKKEANTAIRNLAEKAFGEIDDLIQDGLVKDGFQKIETMSKKGDQEPTTSYGFLISADCDGENFQRLRKEMIDEEIKTIGITTVSGTLTQSKMDGGFAGNSSGRQQKSDPKSKLSESQKQVDEVVGIMRVNVEKVLERDQKLSELDNRANALQQGASQFEQQAGKLKKKMWWKNMKWMIIMGTTAAVVLILIILWISDGSDSKPNP